MKLFGLILMLAAAPVWGQSMAGRYALSGVREVGSELMLKPDGSFEYFLAYGAADYSATGSWKQEKDAVVLTTAGQDVAPFRLVKSAKTANGVVRVWVKAPNGQPVPNIDVALDGGSSARTDSSGVALFPDEKTPRQVTFAIRVYQFRSEPIALTAGDNDFHFEIHGEAITRVRFKGERLKIDGDALELRFWDPAKAMRYVRQ